MSTRVVAICAAILLVSATGIAATSPPPPPRPITIDVGGGQQLELWPYTANDFSGTPSDPVNLVFPGADPRELRQALMALEGSRAPFTGLPFAGCRWRDAMGEEQASWAETEGWTGSAVQLVCVNSPTAPLGDPFRVHLRFFRQGTLTVGATHLDFLIPGTAQHETLSWDFPRNFVAFDMARTGLLTAPPKSVALIAPGHFGSLLRPVYDGLVAGGAGGLLALFGLVAPPSGDVPIPTDGTGTILAPRIAFEPEEARIHDVLHVDYNVTTVKPFCATGSPTDIVHLTGPVDLAITTRTDPSGFYSRVYRVVGFLTVTTVATGAVSQALVFEDHAATMTDLKTQDRFLVSETILSRPPQSLFTDLNAGRLDRFFRKEACGN